MEFKFENFNIGDVLVIDPAYDSRTFFSDDGHVFMHPGKNRTLIVQSITPCKDTDNRTCDYCRGGECQGMINGLCWVYSSRGPILKLQPKWDSQDNN